MIINIIVILFFSLLSLNCQNFSNYSIESILNETQELDLTTKPTYYLPHERLNFSKFDSSFDYCPCNLRTECDINCCCDQTCGKEDRNLFSFCLPTHLEVYKPLYCSHKNVIYINNSKYIIKKDSNGLFCIVWDNIKERNFYPDKMPVTNVQEYRKISSDKQYGWDIERLTLEPIHVSHTFRYGDQLWFTIIANNQLEVNEKWTLPSSILGSNHLCDSFKFIKYLQDSHHTCLVNVNLNSDCASTSILSDVNFFKDIFILKVAPNDHYGRESFSKLNQTLSKNTEIYRKIPDGDRHPCIQNYECIEIIANNSREIKLIINNNNRVCLNAVKKVNYIIQYHPLDGITEIKVLFEHTNINKDGYFRQSFDISFITQLNESLKSSVDKPTLQEYSGNPGYIFGKPILATCSNANFSIQEFLMPRNYDPKGICSRIHNEPIRFGINTKGGCMLNTSFLTIEREVCKSIQKTIIRLLDQSNSNFTHVAAYGNPTNESNDWVPIILDNEPQILQLEAVPELTADGRCPAIVTGYAIDIFYTLVGQQSQPQPKIVSFVKKYLKPMDIRLRCHSFFCTSRISGFLVELSTSVTFVDITDDIRTQYAQAPVITFSLPSDFFYPFSANCSSYISKSTILIILLELLLKFTIYYFHNLKL